MHSRRSVVSVYQHAVGNDVMIQTRHKVGPVYRPTVFANITRLKIVVLHLSAGRSVGWLVHEKGLQARVDVLHFHLCTSILYVHLLRALFVPSICFTLCATTSRMCIDRVCSLAAQVFLSSFLSDMSCCARLRALCFLSTRLASKYWSFPAMQCWCDYSTIPCR